MIQPTRTNLLLLKDRLHAVLNCTTILKGRRQALIKEFLKITKPLMQSREEVSQAYARALDALQVSKARESPVAVDALSAISRRKIAVEVAEGNLLGLRFRDLTMHETVARTFDERPYDMYGSSPWLDETIHEFEAGRFRISRHLEMLRNVGFRDVECLILLEQEIESPTPAQNYACLKAIK